MRYMTPEERIEADNFLSNQFGLEEVEVIGHTCPTCGLKHESERHQCDSCYNAGVRLERLNALETVLIGGVAQYSGLGGKNASLAAQSGFLGHSEGLKEIVEPGKL
jgi:hypothetical protein